MSTETLPVSAASDATKLATSKIDLDNIGLAEARKLMSAEHQALGYRPPPGSLAAEAQKAAAKHPDASLDVDVMELRAAAQSDAARIEAERGGEVGKKAAFGSLNLNDIGQEEAAKLMSMEHKALGYRPPPGSLAAEAQHAASVHPTTQATIPEDILSQAALRDAARIASERGSKSPSNSPKARSGSIKAESPEPKSPPATKAASIQAKAESPEPKSLNNMSNPFTALAQTQTV